MQVQNYKISRFFGYEVLIKGNHAIMIKKRRRKVISINTWLALVFAKNCLIGLLGGISMILLLGAMCAEPVGINQLMVVGGMLAGAVITGSIAALLCGYGGDNDS